MPQRHFACARRCGCARMSRSQMRRKRRCSSGNTSPYRKRGRCSRGRRRSKSRSGNVSQYPRKGRSSRGRRRRRRRRMSWCSKAEGSRQGCPSHKMKRTTWKHTFSLTSREEKPRLHTVWTTQDINQQFSPTQRYYRCIVYPSWSFVIIVTLSTPVFN